MSEKEKRNWWKLSLDKMTYSSSAIDKVFLLASFLFELDICLGSVLLESDDLSTHKKKLMLTKKKESSDL